MKKRIAAILAVAMLALVALPTTVFAHGHKRTSAQNVIHSVCTVEGCSSTGVHKHSGTYYAGHALSDGHTHHQVCPVQDCTKTAAHVHSGSTYFGHHREDGHSYHAGWHYNESHRSGGRHH